MKRLQFVLYVLLAATSSFAQDDKAPKKLTPFEENAKSAIMVRTPAGVMINDDKMKEAKDKLKPKAYQGLTKMVDKAKELYKKEHGGQEWTAEKGRKGFAENEQAIAAKAEKSGRNLASDSQPALDGSQIPPTISFKKEKQEKKP